MSANDMILDVPDLRVVKDCREVIYYYARVKLSQIYIPVLHSDLSELAKNLSIVDQNANDVLLKLNSAIDTTDIETALVDLDELEGSALDDYTRDLDATLNAKKNTLVALRDELYGPTHTLQTMSYTSNTYRLHELTDSRTNLQAIAKVEREEDHYDVMLQKKQSLDLAIEAYESVSFIDKALPLLDQVENIVKASESPATFKKELIKEGVEAAKTVLKIIDGDLKHDQMLTARIELIKKINARNERNDDIDRQLKSNFEETSQIQAFEKLRQPKAEYVAEVQKIHTSIHTFITTVYVGPGVKENANRFVEHARALKAYANNLSPVWLRG
ncbi:alpha-xenorhabdolysin family binary toxin subunit B [Pseudomonas sp. Z1-12]|uniref:alpha-xenorhabdolysin family binary toxin subunit B n=1 Tax=Pseudomonas sp. Z1-12 TaxID=2817408 RepID=UPI003DA8C298